MPMDSEKGLTEYEFLRGVFPSATWNAFEHRAVLLDSTQPKDWDDIEFPIEVAIELTNHCNLRCVMCPSPSLRRTKGYMDQGLFHKVVQDLSKEEGFLFLPQGFGESLLHRQWADMIGVACRSGLRPIVVLSNGMLLKPSNLLGHLGSIDVLVVTLDGVTPNTYEAIRLGASLKTVTENVMRFLETRGPKQDPRLVLRIIRMEDTEGEIKAFVEMWSEKIGKGDRIQIVEVNDWAGKVPYRGSEERRLNRRRSSCRMLWKNLTIYHHGDVSPCCYDAEGELLIGNVLSHSLKEIWKGDPLKRLRGLHLDGQFNEIPLCRECSSWF